MAYKKNNYSYLRDKWIGHHKKLQTSLWEKHGEALKGFMSGSLGGLMLLSSPAMVSLPTPQLFLVEGKQTRDIGKDMFLITDLSYLLPEEVRPLTLEEERKTGDLLSKQFGFKVSAELDGKRLNRSYGFIGAEQHLALYPGDNMDLHILSSQSSRDFYPSGMAPGLGAWGYFARSQEKLSDSDRLREKYYIAVQTFLAPDFNSRVAEYRDFFKYRKMLVVNPQNGKAIVADIADSGPSSWTGKHLGGSPEVMGYLERFDGSQKGPVLYFFIDDLNDSIPLGPIKI